MAGESCHASVRKRSAREIAGRKLETRLDDAAAFAIAHPRLIGTVLALEPEHVVAELVDAALHEIGRDRPRCRRLGASVTVVGRRRGYGADGDSKASQECGHLHLTLPMAA